MLVSACVWSERPPPPRGMRRASRWRTSSNWSPSPPGSRSAVAGVRPRRGPSHERHVGGRCRRRRPRGHHGRAGVGADEHLQPGQSRPRAGTVPGPPLGRVHPGGGRAAAYSGPGVRDRQARQSARIPLVPRAGGTGLNDGAVPLRGGIVVDVKRMNEIKEIDLVDRAVTRRPRHQHAQAQRGAEEVRRVLPGHAGLVPVLAGGGESRAAGSRCSAPGSGTRATW